MILRTSSHTIKFANTGKKVLYKKIVSDYQWLLQKYIDLIYEKKLPLKTNLSSKELPILNDIVNANWRVDCYREAVQTYRSVLAKYKGKKCHKPFTKPIIKSHSVNINYHLWDIEKCEEGEFDYFIRIFSPYLKTKTRYFTFNIPIKFHYACNCLKDQGFEFNNRTMMLRDNGMLCLYWEKEEVAKHDGRPIGVDCGYKKLLACSDGKVYGKELEGIYEKISRKKQRSKAFKRALIERDQAINRTVKKFYNEHKDCGQIIVENLKNVKRGKKFSKKFNNKLQRWSYTKVMNKLGRFSEEEGFLLIKVPPAYTSQRCHVCNTVDKSSRQGEVYHCRTCGAEMDADINAAINILHLGVYSPQNLKAERQ